MEKLFVRKYYLDELVRLKDQHFIKVLTGIRWSGKSTILLQFQEILKNNFKIEESQIIEYDFNDLELQSLTYIELHKEIIKKANPHKTNYVFLDEIQEIKNWEKCVISLYENKKIKFDIYITGSNAKLLSTELSTLLTGRHTDIHVMPLSFKEFIELSDSKYKENPALLDYLKIGGLGVIIPILNDYKQISEVLKDIFNDTITKDIKHRHKNQNNLLINKIIEYVYTNIGKQINPENIINYLVSKKEGTFDKKTINNYLTWACDAMLLYRVNYFDIKTKTILRTSGKYYAGDLGLLTANTNFNDNINGYKLENAVFLKLIEMGYDVFTNEIYNGKGNKEIDFVAVKNQKVSYFQVCAILHDDNYEREVGNLLSIRDGFSKNVVILEDKSTKPFDGVNRINLIEFLKGKF